ncbi:hypothetical protein WICMUC_000946 [Wickerhamomyces mucosus]|uniref:HMG box domain-containing protein n=1 Tax=Wickerhamomyces mucosus TaxID=1378264 RepID=A0A9P8THY8_9ASCO|nr:hypothetical protein WICMUC_000946 [Wickerhamomyces mucosus]
MTENHHKHTHSSERELKCKELKQKIEKVEDNNQLAALAISRTKISINRLRLEYSILLERLENKAILPQEDLSDLSDIEISDKKASNKKRKLGSNNSNSGNQHSSSNGINSNISAPKERDPDLPKRPLNPYLIFCELEKENFKKRAEVEGKQIDLSKTLGEAWKSMDNEAKTKYNEIYNKEKLKYNEEMKLYEEKKRVEAEAASKKLKQDGNDDDDDDEEEEEEEEREKDEGKLEQDPEEEIDADSKDQTEEKEHDSTVKKEDQIDTEIEEANTAAASDF